MRAPTARRALPASPTASRQGEEGRMEVLSAKREQQRQVLISQPSERSLEEEDEDYDDYEDDFEEQEPVEMMQAAAKNEPEKKVVSLQPAKKSAGVKITQVEALQKAVKSENAALAQRRKNLEAQSVHANASVPKAEAKPEAKSVSGTKATKATIQQRQAKYGGNRPITSRPHILDPRLKKARAIREKLSLSSERYLALDLPPVTPHQIYLLKMRSNDATFRESEAMHTRKDAESSTDPIETTTKEMQFALGDDDTDFLNLMTDRQKKKSQDNTPDVKISDQARLSAFLLTAAPVMESLLMENTVPEDQDESSEEGYMTKTGLEVDGALGVVASPTRPTLLLVIERTVVSLWETRLQRKLATLRSEGEPTVAALATPNGSVACAGTVTGTLVFWDLRKCTKVAAQLPQDASITTATLGIEDDIIGHKSTIIALHPLTHDADARPVDRNALVATQLVSVDDRGLVCLWLLTEASKDDMENDADASLKVIQLRSYFAWASLPRAALGPLSREIVANKTNELKTLETASLDTILSVTGPGPLAVRAIPSYKDPNECLVILTRGAIIRCSQFGNLPSPSAYYVNTQALMRSTFLVSRPVCLDMSPLMHDLFLVGCDDGGCTLHSLKTQIPLLLFPPSNKLDPDIAVLDIAWSKHRPGVFFVLYSDGSLAVYDLLESASTPCTVTPGKTTLNIDLDEQDTKDQDDDDFFFVNPSAPIPVKIGGPTPQLTLSAGSKQYGFVAVQFQGVVTVHSLSKRATTPAEDEIQKLRDAIEDAVDLIF